MRRELREMFDEVLGCLDVERTMRGMPQLERLHDRDLLVIGFGKAARAMAEALLAVVKTARMRGLVVPPEPDCATLPPFEVVPGGHPLPTQGSIDAARRALELARSAQAHETVVFLVSGGGSAMLELPGDDSVTLDELRTFYQALVGCGADIDAMNTVRMHLSAIKGGRLALAAAGAREHLTLGISDVPLGSLALASSPTLSTETTRAHCLDAIDRYQLASAVPAALLRRIRGEGPALPIAPFPQSKPRAEFVCMLDERSSSHAASQFAAARGWVVDRQTSVDNWPYERAAEHLLTRLEELRQAHPGKTVALVTTGELSVPLPANPGVGGRNLQFALFAATRIAGRAITVCSCGTDGIDGNAPAAGAIVDGTTVARAAKLGLDANEHLRRCDAHPLLAKIGDTVVTGPSGTNVRDLRVLVSQPEAR